MTERLENLRDDIFVVPWAWLNRITEEDGARVTWEFDDPHYTWCAEHLTSMPRIMIIPGADATATPVAQFACASDMIQFKLVWLVGD